MTAVRVAIFHPLAGPDDGPLTTSLAEARGRLASRHALRFGRAGADEVRIHAGRADDRRFGERLRDLLEGLGPDDGLVVLGSGAVPLLTDRLAGAWVTAARASTPAALVNNRYSADLVAVSCVRQTLRGVESVPNDNILPRWLAETAGIPVAEPSRADRRRLALDIDTPLDLLLLGGAWERSLAPGEPQPVRERIEAVRAVADDARAELLVAGRLSSDTLAFLERWTRARTRALVEERGLRTATHDQRPPSSILGRALDREGPEVLGTVLAGLGEAAVVDTRVLLAHRLGRDERRWPNAEDRFASDLLLPERVADPWLRALTAAARDAPIPVLLGAHSLVGPGLRHLLRRTARG